MGASAYPSAPLVDVKNMIYKISNSHFLDHTEYLYLICLLVIRLFINDYYYFIINLYTYI